MKIIKKISTTLLGFSLAAALFFGCSNSVPDEQPEDTTSAGSNTTSETSENTSEGVSSNGVTFYTTYTEPTLPANEGLDPFKGKTYLSGNKGYAFGNDGTLIYTKSSHDKTKYQYTYNATTKELSLKLTHKYLEMDNNESTWATFSQLVDFYRNYSYSDYVNQQNQYGEEAESETVFCQMLQEELDSDKADFEKLYVYKAEINSSGYLRIRTKYYKTAPTQLPCTENIEFQDTNNNSIRIYIRPDVNEGYGEKSTIQIGNDIDRQCFIISNVSSNTISAREATYSSGHWIYLENGRQLTLNYSLTLGDDNNILLTLSSADTETNSFFQELMVNSITLSTSTTYKTYLSSTAPIYTEPSLPENVGVNPFAGNTYTATYGGTEQYVFGNDGTLTYSNTFNNQQSVTKWQYTYNANTNELNLKLTHAWVPNGNSGSSLTFNQLYDYYSRYENAETLINSYKEQFETITVYGAKVNNSNLELRTLYYQTAPSRLPYTKNLIFWNRTLSNEAITVTLETAGENQGYQNKQGQFRISNTWFVVTGISENLITAQKAIEQTNGTLAIDPTGDFLQMNYSLSHDDTNKSIVITLTPVGSTTENWFGGNIITLNTDLEARTYTLQQ